MASVTTGNTASPVANLKLRNLDTGETCDVSSAQHVLENLSTFAPNLSPVEMTNAKIAALPVLSFNCMKLAELGGQEPVVLTYVPSHLTAASALVCQNY